MDRSDAPHSEIDALSVNSGSFWVVEDELDRANARLVERMFEVVDRILYNRPLLPEECVEECVLMKRCGERERDRW